MAGRQARPALHGPVISHHVDPSGWRHGPLVGVLRDRDLWHMWYSYRGDRYRIGYAQSRDGLDWTRMDHEGGLWPQGTAWESEMVEYGHVFTHRDELYMVYNGNGYGLTGLGVARGTIPTAMVP